MQSNGDKSLPARQVAYQDELQNLALPVLAYFRANLEAHRIDKKEDIGSVIPINESDYFQGNSIDIIGAQDDGRMWL